MKSHVISVKKCARTEPKAQLERWMVPQWGKRRKTYSVLARIVIHLQQLERKKQRRRLTCWMELLRWWLLWKPGFCELHCFLKFMDALKASIRQYCCTRPYADWTEVKRSPRVFELRAEITLLFFYTHTFNLSADYMTSGCSIPWAFKVKSQLFSLAATKPQN